MITQNYTFFLLFLLSFSLLILTGCKEEENKRVSASIEKAIEIGESRPKEARLILDSIQVNDLSKENFMLYQIADVQNTYYADKPLRRDQANKIAQAAKYFENKKDDRHAALANFYTGVAYYHIDELVLGFAHYLKSYPYARAINDSSLMGKSLYNSARMYLDQKVYDSVTVYLEKAILVFKDRPGRLFKTYQTMAFNYYVLGEHDNAVKALEKSDSLRQRLNDSNYNFLYHNTCGLVYASMGEYEKSAAHLSINVANENSFSPKEQLRTYFNIANAYNLANNTDSANYYIEKAEPLLNDLESQYSKLISDNNLLLWGYSVIKDYYAKTNNPKKFTKYNQLFKEKDREIVEVNLGHKFLEINKLIDIEQIIKDNKLYQTRVLICIFVASILFFMFTFFIIYKYAGKKNKVNTNLILAKIDNHRRELNKMRKEECPIFLSKK